MSKVVEVSYEERGKTDDDLPTANAVRPSVSATAAQSKSIFVINLAVREVPRGLRGNRLKRCRS